MIGRRSTVSRCLLPGIVALAASSCGGDKGSVGPPGPPAVPVASITVTPAAGTVVPFGAVQFTATLKDASGNELSGRNVTWTTGSAAIAAVSNAGLVTGVGLGTTTVTASAEGRSGSANVAVKNGKALAGPGGTVTGLDGAVTLVIPPGALAQVTDVSLEAAQGLPTEPRLIPGTAADIGPAGTTLAQPATLTIQYAAANLPAGSHPDSLALYAYSNGVWVAVAGSAVDTAKRTVQANVSKLAVYGTLLPARLSELAVVSLKLRTPLVDFDLCVNQSYALSIEWLDGSGNPLPARAITAVSAAPSVASVKAVTGSPDEFFLHGLSAGTASVNFNSDGVAQTVTAHVTVCPKPAILATSNKDGNLELYRYQAGTFTRLTNDSAADDLGRVAPDSSRIAFQSDRAGGVVRLYTMNLDGSNVKPLLASPGEQRELAWGPSGTFLVHMPKPGGHGGIYRVDADGTTTLLTPDTTTDEANPAFSPGGLYVAFQQRSFSGSVPGPFHIEVMHADGTLARQLVDNGGANDIMPSFSPLKPGNPEILFVRNFATDSWVVRMRFDGSHMQVVGGGGSSYFPSFCQDGEQIIVGYSAVRDVGPFGVIVRDAWLSGADDPVYIVGALQQYFHVSYFPQPANPQLVYGCRP